MDAVSYIRMDITRAHELLETVMLDATPEQLAWMPPGLANPLGATYAHAVSAEDGVVQGLVKGEPKLFESSWKNKTGISEPQFHADFEWTRRVKVDLPQVRQYAKAVYQATDDYLASLGESDLDRVLDLSRSGFGERTIGWVLSALVLSHMNNMIGEISVLKGLQGAKGYPW